ncbi:FAD-binding oxygenase [Chloropicon primus]|uniref:FAD-binding oxygenase n=1 Tax=Chloropicon primus TaxID=1764295 RepID=A0A5B8MY73_9CHLO|nr:FAD-binding oxygenase [Chloropicon primus]UPR03689.1 FAD-binding oxygenase [Chloropicon primus]|mmetsp:Transcript_11944/g.33007  ORF Transcript_11944/g.33007 Transcript_11944/m.33007 type:complete len:563 (-) Transcript_11944:45-1733(-)|eukprot:QDZ24480.1 FAD-binding oxygenase [Chloropicon primus]
MESSPLVDVLIAGAGPCGLLLANDLARRRGGLKLRVIDAAEGPSVHTKAMAVQIKTLEIYDDLGLSERAIEEGLVLKGTRVVWGRGQEVQMALRQIPDQSPLPGMLIFPQFQNENMLIDSLERYGRKGLVEYSTKLVGFEKVTRAASSGGEDHILCHCERGGEAFSVKTRFLVGAEGAHSVVRKTLGLAFDGKKFEEEFLLCDCEIEKADAAESGGRYLEPGDMLSFLDGTLFVAFPYKWGGYRIVMTRSEERMGKEATMEEVQKVCDLLPTKLAVKNPRWISPFRIHSRVVDQFGDLERVFLVGDAAHIHSPAGGQGMNTGLQDSYNLGWKLWLACQSKASAALIKSFSLERQPIGRTLIRTTDTAFSAVAGSSVMFRMLRSVMFSALGRKFLLPEVERRIPQLVAQLWISYRSGPLALSVLPRKFFGSWPLQAGDRLPFLKLEKGTTTLDLVRGPHFTVLFLASSTAAAEELCSEVVLKQLEVLKEGAGLKSFLLSCHQDCRGPPGIESLAIADPADFKRKFGGITDGMLLVRPDKYIGYMEALGMKSRLSEYLERLFKP